MFKILSERQEKYKNISIGGILATNPHGYGELVGRFNEIEDLKLMTYEEMKEE